MYTLLRTPSADTKLSEGKSLGLVLLGQSSHSLSHLNSTPYDTDAGRSPWEEADQNPQPPHARGLLLRSSRAGCDHGKRRQTPLEVNQELADLGSSLKSPGASQTSSRFWESDLDLVLFPSCRSAHQPDRVPFLPSLPGSAPTPPPLLLGRLAFKCEQGQSWLRRLNSAQRV